MNTGTGISIAVLDKNKEVSEQNLSSEILMYNVTGISTNFDWGK
jgi:hypothetical protein